MTVRNAEPRLLLIETSGRAGRVATALGGELGSVRVLEASRRHARDLAPAIAGLGRERGWRVRDLDAVVVSRGPGSYTGLRVGLMTAKALVYASGAVLLAMDTFAVIAAQSPLECESLDVLADAQQRNLYVQRFVRRAGVWQPASELTILHATEWLKNRPRDVWASGPGLSLIETELPDSVPRVALSQREPGLASMLALGLTRWQAGESDDYWRAEPLYLRPSNAEVNWDAKVKKDPGKVANPKNSNCSQQAIEVEPLRSAPHRSANDSPQRQQEREGE